MTLEERVRRIETWIAGEYGDRSIPEEIRASLNAPFSDSPEDTAHLSFREQLALRIMRDQPLISLDDMMARIRAIEAEVDAPRAEDEAEPAPTARTAAGLLFARGTPRNRWRLDGASAQALEGALAQADRECDSLRAEPGMSKDDVVRPFWEKSARREKRIWHIATLRDAVVEAAVVAASAPAIIRDPNGYLDRMKALRDAVDAYLAAKEIP